MDSFTEVSHEGWGGRIMESIKGVLVGVVLFLGSFVLLFWNEGRAVRDARRLAEGASATVSLPEATPDPANDGKLVHVTGEATTDETVTDPVFGVSAQGIQLRRKVEAYQWEEEKRRRRRKKLGGGTKTVTTYDYDKTWSERPIDSSDFRKPTGHENPPMQYRSETVLADRVALGGFRLPESLIRKVPKAEPLPVNANDVPDDIRQKVKPSGQGLYIGANPASPAVGDHRIAFSVVKPQVVSLIAQQAGDTFQPYQAEVGGTIEMLEAGTRSADAMFEAAKARSRTMTWILRLGGFIAMAVGLGLIANPLVVVADVVPFLGDLLGLGVALFAGLVALCLSLVTIAVAWLFYRPLLGVLLIVLGVGALLGVRQLLKGRQAQAADGAPAA
ncbi:MAG: TMEM43 family protein [Planctomycetota bacterium]